MKAEPYLIEIPAGPFLMGTSDSQIDWLAERDPQARRWKEKGYFQREQPQRLVHLRAYSIAKFPVTVGEYREFILDGGYLNDRLWTDAGWTWLTSTARAQPDHWDEARWAGDDRLPVVGVSWYEAAAYCRWLSEASGRPYRLPSEAEWEKAARGTDGRLFPWGDTFEAGRCNTRESGLNGTLPVGRDSPTGDSPYGCVEMGGNASDWTLSQFKPYPYDEHDGRNGEAGQIERVTRGGSWFKPLLRARTAVRGMNDPFFADHDVGFRCACIEA